LLAGPLRADDYTDLVSAEQMFAADAAVRGTRAAFLAALADDGTVFAPGPGSGKAVWTARADNKNRLEWAPAVAEVAASGDLGYTSGPWRYTVKGDDKPSAFGHYLTVWKKQADGHWKVLVDHGIGHAEVPFPDKVVRRGAIAAGSAPTWPVGMAELRIADQAPAGLLTAAMVSDDFLRMREGSLPDGQGSGEALPGGTGTRLEAGYAISAAGDMAASWGGSADGPSWLRIWRRPAAGDPPGLGWRLAVDLGQPAPPPPEETK
jgi:ketosteroid isomerase-like protein